MVDKREDSQEELENFRYSFPINATKELKDLNISNDSLVYVIVNAAIFIFVVFFG
jgi:hypothetical protein